MAVLVIDQGVENRLRAEREETGADRFDEVWEGTYIMAPLPNNEHQNLQLEIAMALRQATAAIGAQVFPGVNISDSIEAWERNYRCPDAVVFLPSTSAKDCGTHWFGGPDLAVEIVSPNDRTRKKLPFYSSIGTRELFILDRDPWSLQMHRLRAGKLKRIATSTPNNPAILASAVLPLTFQLVPNPARPRLIITHRDTGQTWTM
jgi:Uma2 family endonuclease